MNHILNLCWKCWTEYTWGQFSGILHEFSLPSRTLLTLITWSYNEFGSSDFSGIEIKFYHESSVFVRHRRLLTSQSKLLWHNSLILNPLWWVKDKNKIWKRHSNFVFWKKLKRNFNKTQEKNSWDKFSVDYILKMFMKSYITFLYFGGRYRL